MEDWEIKGSFQCECNKPYPCPDHGETCVNCGEEILEKGDEKLFEQGYYQVVKEDELELAERRGEALQNTKKWKEWIIKYLEKKGIK